MNLGRAAEIHGCRLSSLKNRAHAASQSCSFLTSRRRGNRSLTCAMAMCSGTGWFAFVLGAPPALFEALLRAAAAFWASDRVAALSEIRGAAALVMPPSLMRFVGPWESAPEGGSLRLRLGLPVGEEEEEEEAAAAAEAMAMAEAANDGGNGIATGIAVGGLQGTVACEILRMGDGRSAVAAFRGNGTTTTTTTIAPSFVCDDRNRIHLPSTTTATTTAAGGSYGETTTTTEAAAELANLRQNRKSDRSSRNLTPDQLEEIDAVLERYDCGVWRHLRRYQRRGLLRVLSPSKRLFGGCDFDDSDDGGGGSSSSLLSSKPRRRDDDLTFREAIDAVAEIAARDNGIPFQTDEEEASYASERTEQYLRMKKRSSLLLVPKAAGVGG
mmetsp:Transcript_20554/g.48396  ORF Transcript_20554/g.48396 Transcript_20554/m.48396 type:complete len:384 (+) Transcript_20554:2135-3286(+)